MNRLFIATLFATAVALAQGPGGHFGGGMHIMGMQGMRPGQVVTGAPFSGQQVTTETKTLANGTHITNNMTAQFYRDSSGRTRVERTFSKVGPWSSGQPTATVEIFDPVAGTVNFLNPAKLTAIKSTVPSMPAGAPRMPHKDSAQVTTVSLGTQVIQGLSCTGTMTTRTIPAGQMGNDQAITITDERWYSPDLQMAVMTKHTDPMEGEINFALQNISRTAPDAALFQVPSTYTVTTKTAGHGRGPGMEIGAPPPPMAQ